MYATKKYIPKKGKKNTKSELKHPIKTHESAAAPSDVLCRNDTNYSCSRVAERVQYLQPAETIENTVEPIIIVIMIMTRYSRKAQTTSEKLLSKICEFCG